MEGMMIALIGFVVVLVLMVVAVVLCFCCSKKSNKDTETAHSPHTVQTEEQSGPQSGMPTSVPAVGYSKATQSNSAEKIEQSSTMMNQTPRDQPKPFIGSLQQKSVMMPPIFSGKPLTNRSSLGDKSGEKGRLKLKHFKHIGTHKRFTKLPNGPLVHSYSMVARKTSAVTKILTKEIKGDIITYPPDFTVPLPLIAATRRKAEILEQYYHLGTVVMDQAEYQRRRRDSLAFHEPIPVEGNHEKVKNTAEGTPILEIRPHLAKMPAKRDDTIRHYIINTQYASRIAVRFRCASGRYVSIPSHEIIEQTGRLRVVIVANSDMEEQPEKPELVYYEYIQVPERAMDAVQEFQKRPVIGKITLRLFPNSLNLSPNTFYPSTRRRTNNYTATLTNNFKWPCKFVWPDEREVTVNPQTGYIKPNSSVQFTFNLKNPVAIHAIVAEMKYTLTDKPNAHGSMTARFETANFKRLIQLTTKALSAVDTAEDPGYFAG